MANNVGLVAGWGRYPIVVAEALKRAGHRVSCLGIKDHADPNLAGLCDDFDWLGLGKMGKAIRYFNQHDVQLATMAGKVHKVLLFQRGWLFKHMPDWTGAKTFYPHFFSTRKDRRDDTILGAIVDRFAHSGIAIAPATDYVPELLVPAGQLTRRGATAAQQKDIAFGWHLAKEMGRLDVGQSVAVKDRAAIAIEAIEGTDECIRRAGQLCTKGEFTLVKVAKPQQDMRFDVPTIGLWTVQNLQAAGGRVLAIEAGRTIIVDQSEVIEFADQHKLVIVSLEDGHVCAE